VTVYFVTQKKKTVSLYGIINNINYCDFNYFFFNGGGKGSGDEGADKAMPALSDSEDEGVVDKQVG
jgi:hypothetical protein